MILKSIALLLIFLMMITKSCSVSIDKMILKARKNVEEDIVNSDTGDVTVELDMVLKPDQYLDHMSTDVNDRRKKRKAWVGERYRWTDKVMPYIYKDSFSREHKKVVQDSMDHVKKHTCLTFREKTASDKNYVSFVHGGGCSSFIGMIGGSQDITLSTQGCMWLKVVVHEIGHAAGLVHEQTRPDRDAYVRINFGNVQSGLQNNFKIFPTSKVDTMDIPYDYTSIMHYGESYFSNNGKPTIITKDKSYQKVIGNAEGLSFRDVEILNKMYSCAETCKDKTCPKDSFMDKNCKCRCKGDGDEPTKPCSGEEEDTTPDPSESTTAGTTDSGEKTTASPDKTTASPEDSTVPPEKTTTSGCNDQHEHCKGWKGFCQDDRFKVFLEKNCKATCDFCEVGGTTAKPPDKNECLDKHEWCKGWARAGYCTGTHADYMKNICKESCDLCNDDPNCRDVIPCCGELQSKCENSDESASLAVLCKKTCGKC